MICNNCKKEGWSSQLCCDKIELIWFQGHKTLDCKDNRLLDWSKIADKTPDDAWEGMKVADADRDLDDLREVRQTTVSYILNSPDSH